jgi:hypothetical protein
MSNDACKKKHKCKTKIKTKIKTNMKTKTKHNIKNEYSKLVSENIVRIILNSIPACVKTFIGSYYAFIHSLLAFLGLMIMLFSNNLLYLSALLLVIILDSLSIVFLHDCPLTMLEKKYLGTSTVSARRAALKNMGILFTCDHEYESQLELLINMWTIVAIKMFVIIACDIFYFHIQSV